MGRSVYMLAAITAEQQTAIEEMLRRTDLPPRVRVRLEMLKAASQGYDLEGIEAWSRRSPRTVRVWLERFAAGGMGQWQMCAVPDGRFVQMLGTEPP
jgi:hypothetical protein